MRASGAGAWGSALVVTLVLGACATERSGDRGADGAAASDTAARAAAGGTVAQGAEPGTVSATLTEWSVALAPATLPAGEVTFRVVNAGTIHHALEVEGEGVEEETEHLQPGRDGTLTVRLPPGTYEVYCPVDDETGDHRELGMTTRLVVQ
jgi:uncharacterized cupredoxin-like copper-binding protein